MRNRDCAFAQDKGICADRPGIFLWGWNSITPKKQGGYLIEPTLQDG